MKLVTTHISIGRLIFDFVHKLEVETSWENLTDTALIVLPASLKLDRNNLKELLKKGDPVVIKIGYDSVVQTVFEGFLTDIKPSTPIELKCEDLMWKLKQINVSKSFRGGALIDFLRSVMPGIEIDAFDLQISAFRANNISAAKLLDEIKSDFGFQAFVRNGKLVVGKQYDPQTAIKHIFKIDNNMVADDLEFRLKDDVKLKVKAISNNPDGTKTEVEIGDEDGDVRTLNYYDLPKQTLKTVAEKEIDRLKYDGWRGTFTAFGEPIVKHGDLIELRHSKESDKIGTYYADAVMYECGLGGIRQTITLGARA